MAVGLLVALTGAGHLAGLAAAADACGDAGRDETPRSASGLASGRLGTATMIAALLAKWAALRTLAGCGCGGSVVAAIGVARAMVPVLYVLQTYVGVECPVARTARSAQPRHAIIAVELALAVGLIAAGAWALVYIAAGLVLAVAIGAASYRWSGGITRNVPGAACELIEIAVLALACVAVMPSPG
jgi:cobalamin synthase